MNQQRRTIIRNETPKLKSADNDGTRTINSFAVVPEAATTYGDVTVNPDGSMSVTASTSGAVMEATPSTITANHTFTGGATFTTVAPSSSVTPALAGDLVNKSYVDTADINIIAGSMLRAIPHTVTANHTYTGGATYTTVAPTTSVTPVSANDIANKAYVDAATSGGDSGGSPPKTLLSIGTSTASIANTSADLTWDTPEISDSDITISSNEVTFAVAGTYAIDVTARMFGTGRVEGQLTTFKDTGGGYSELTNHKANQYSSRDTDQDLGNVTLNTMLSLGAGDKLKFVCAGNTDATGSLQTEGTILRIVGYT